MTDDKFKTGGYILGETRERTVEGVLRHIAEILNEYTVLLYGLMKHLNVTPDELVKLGLEQGIISDEDPQN